MGVVAMRYIDFLILLLIPTPLVLALFCSSIPTSLFIFLMFSCSLIQNGIVKIYEILAFHGCLTI